MFWRRRKERQLADAREEARRWYERLGGQITTLHGDAQAVKQALADAGERYTAAGAQLERSQTPRQYELARETALEGLYYVRAARTAMGLDPGPELPAVPSQRGTGEITQERELEVQGHHYRASPRPGDSTPYYHPGGRIQGRPVPAGWYSEPWWRSGLSTGAGIFGGMLLFDMLSGGFHNAAMYDQGFAPGYDQGFDQGAEGDFGGDMGGDFGGDFGGFGDF